MPHNSEKKTAQVSIRFMVRSLTKEDSWLFFYLKVIEVTVLLGNFIAAIFSDLLLICASTQSTVL